LNLDGSGQLGFVFLTTSATAPPRPQARGNNAVVTMPDDKKPQSKTIVFLHPDLGIGGAERLVVDAAVGLQKRGHKVVIFTSHCDPAHCFDEARDGNHSSCLGLLFRTLNHN
jgi:hypothetical protein